SVETSGCGYLPDRRPKILFERHVFSRLTEHRYDGLIDLLKSHNWAEFARRYNGPNYAANNYDGLLGHFYERCADGPPRDLTTRAVQILLMYRGFPPGAIDGVAGAATRRAILEFQGSTGSGKSGVVDHQLLRTL